MNNLENVNPGDLVTIFRSGRSPSICVVKRVTKTRIIIDHNDYEQAWRKSDGGLVGDSSKFRSGFMRFYQQR